MLNVSKDHKGVDELKGLFATLISRTRWSATNADDPVLASLPATVRFGLASATAGWRPDATELLPASVRLVKGGVRYDLPLPGRHNLENLAAALCVCEYLGCIGAGLAAAVKGFAGTARRFDITQTKGRVSVIDDFAHNPAKITAALTAAKGLSARIIAVYQPHGFGPTRFLKDEYIAAFRAAMQPGDSLYLLPIYYAGGTAQKNISSEEIVEALGETEFVAKAIKDRDDLLTILKADARPGDAIIIMGARDPSLPRLVRQTIKLFGGPT